jgi:hypothetical protein
MGGHYRPNTSATQTRRSTRPDSGHGHKRNPLPRSRFAWRSEKVRRPSHLPLVVAVKPGTRSTAAVPDSSEYSLEIEGLLPFHCIVGRFTPLGSQGLRGQCPAAFGDLVFVETFSPPDGGNPEFENTRIIIVNGVVKQEEIDQLFKPGAEDFVHKPFTITKEAGATKAGLHAIEGNTWGTTMRCRASNWPSGGGCRSRSNWPSGCTVAAFAHTVSTVTKPGPSPCYRTGRSSGSWRSS